MLPLGPASRELIDHNDVGGLIFGSLTKPGVQMSGWSKLLRPIRAAHEQHFTLHDLRRPFRTGWEEQLQAPHSICELAIGHKPSKLIFTYSRAEQLQLRSAFQRQWERLITDAVAEVTRLRMRVVST